MDELKIEEITNEMDKIGEKNNKQSQDIDDSSSSEDFIDPLLAITGYLKANLEITTRKSNFKTYHKCFIGCDAVKLLVDSEFATDELEAIAIGEELVNNDFIHHVHRDHTFKNENLFYRFSCDEEHGHQLQKGEAGADVIDSLTWTDVAVKFEGEDEKEKEIDEEIEVKFDTAVKEVYEHITLQKHNEKLLDNVHPLHWVNPKADKKYNMVVIGAGVGGLVSAAIAARTGSKVALIEKEALGGDCLVTGCVPSKSLLSSARVVRQFKSGYAASLGIEVDPSAININFPRIMESLRETRAKISQNDSARRFADNFGADVYLGSAKFINKNSIVVDGQILEFAKCIIATGARARIPPIEGIESIPYRTNSNIWNMTELPKSMGIIGSGPIGVEMAQAFALFGTEVTVFEEKDRIMPREDADASVIVRRSLENDGVCFQLGSTVQKVSLTEDKRIKLISEGSDGSSNLFEFDELLLASGRVPNVESLDLESANIEYTTRYGITVDDKMHSVSQKNIFAVGDVCSHRVQFTHAADAMARLAVRNALFMGRAKFSNIIIPWCTYTDPEVAHVGSYDWQLRSKGIEFVSFQVNLDEIDRALCERRTDGFIRILRHKKNDRILGCTIVAPNAGDIISEVGLAMQLNIGLGQISSVIHPYPTIAEGIRKLADQSKGASLTPNSKKVLRTVLKFTA